MQIKLKTIASFSQGEQRLQLLKVTKYAGTGSNLIYQVRLNRKIIEKSISEYKCRRTFAVYCQNIVLQLKIY